MTTTLDLYTNNIKGGIMTKLYKVLVKFDAMHDADAENFVLDMSPKDWLEHLEEEE